MSVTKSWHRPWICTDGHCRKDENGTNVYVLQCDRCNKVTSVTIRGVGDPLLEVGWTGDFDTCYCKDCK